MNHQQTVDSLLKWITSTTPKGAKVLIPISGGSDSAFCYWLYNQALPGQAKGIFIGTDLRASEWFEQIGQVMYSDAELAAKHPEIERWAHFLNVSIQENRILVGSRNKTEDTLGTFSHASRVAAILPLAGLWKSQVMELCRYVEVPAEIIASSHRADPACGRPQRMADIPFEVVDAFLQAKQGAAIPCPATPDQLTYLERVYAANSYKKTLPLKGIGTKH